MTEQEAMEILKKPCLCDYDLSKTIFDCDIEQCDKRDAVLQAIKALEEVQTYRAIGAPEECRVAVEKQEAKKPNKCIGFTKSLFVCPACGRKQPIMYEQYYCKECGQKLDLSDVE